MGLYLNISDWIAFVQTLRMLVSMEPHQDRREEMVHACQFVE